MLHDLRYACRSLLKTRGFTVVAVLTLALGIGANTAIFSVARALLLTPPGYPEPERIMVLNETRLPQFPTYPVSGANFLDWKAAIPRLVAGQLGSPERRPLLRPGCMLGAAMPEAAVHKHRGLVFPLPTALVS